MWLLLFSCFLLSQDDLLLSAEEEQSDEEEEEEEEDEAYFISEENYQEAYKREMRIWEYWADPERAFGRLGRKGDQGESEGKRGTARESEAIDLASEVRLCPPFTPD